MIRNFFHLYLIIIPIAFLIAYFIAEWAVELFGGNNYLRAAYLLPLALVSILFVQSSQANGFGYSIKRKTYYIMYITFFSVALNYVFSLLFGYFIGLEGVILGTLLAGIFKTYIYTLFSEKLYSFDYSFKLITLISILCLILFMLSGKGIV